MEEGGVWGWCNELIKYFQTLFEDKKYINVEENIKKMEKNWWRMILIFK